MCGGLKPSRIFAPSFESYLEPNEYFKVQYGQPAERHSISTLPTTACQALSIQLTKIVGM